MNAEAAKVMHTIFNSADVPSPERVDAFREITATSLVASTIIPLEPATFEARLQGMSLGAAHISSMSYTALRSQRTPALIRQSDPELYQIALVTAGRQVIQQERRSAVLSAGDLVLYDSSRPFHTSVRSDGASADSVVLQFPKELLPLPGRQIAQLLAVPLQGRVGIGRLLAQYLTGLIREHDGYTPRNLNRLGDTALNLATAMLAHLLDCESGMSPESRQLTLFMRAHAFIDQHLSDPQLTPTTVAAACQTSTRHLQRLFQEQGLTLSGHIRQRRLERCRQDLADPQNHRPLHAIAARWGLTDPAHFSRAFRTAFGIPPSAYRRLAQGGEHTV
ncbi:helix-turn-helix domain-containing protein [Streptomyces sp. NPDC018947]|uniref:AraC-like ligand-binding domain-containing protein n=1 Tax=Streptomyces sp. NPDC018947 TaxID=3365054 RepID=UPI0037A04E89